MLRDLQRPIYTVVSTTYTFGSERLFSSISGPPQPWFISSCHADELRSNGNRCYPLPAVTFTLECLPPRSLYVRPKRSSRGSAPQRLIDLTPGVEKLL
jgi:hypothetical protein